MSSSTYATLCRPLAILLIFGAGLVAVQDFNDDYRDFLLQQEDLHRNRIPRTGLPNPVVLGFASATGYKSLWRALTGTDPRTARDLTFAERAWQAFRGMLPGGAIVFVVVYAIRAGKRRLEAGRN